MGLYEMHQHLAGCSACSRCEPEKAVKSLVECGFDGMVITDHFYHGNTGVKRNQPWADFVRAYEKTYEITKQIGDKFNFDVLFGVEEGVGDGKEVLLYGITPQLLYDNPDWPKYGLKEISEVTRQAGGLVVQAHPFRVRDYIPEPWATLPSEYLDGIEVYNAGNSDFENLRAVQLAEHEGLPVFAGSDTHHMKQELRYGMLFPDRIQTERELAQAIINGDYELYLGE